MTAVQGLNFMEKLNNEVVKDGAKFRAWMTRFMAYLCASAHRADVRLEPYLKSLMNTSMDASTEEMFRQRKGYDLVLSKMLERFSEEVQFMLVSLVEGEVCEIVVRTPNGITDGNGLDSLRRLH